MANKTYKLKLEMSDGSEKSALFSIPLTGQSLEDSGEIFNDYNNNTAGAYAHAEGHCTQATGAYSHAEGSGEIAIYNTEVWTNVLITGIPGEANLEGCNVKIVDVNDPANVVTAQIETFDQEDAEWWISYESIDTSMWGSEYAYYETPVNIFIETNSTVSGAAAHAEGIGTTASGTAAHAEGYLTKATYGAAHAEGSYTTASGESSHAEGYYSEASGESSHAEGSYTTASGESSHAEGRESRASEESSHAEGSYTRASGYAAHAEGSSTQATASSAHAEGMGTVAASAQQHVQGKYNIIDAVNDYAHIVGNGVIYQRSNAHTLDWDGNAWFAGAINCEDKTTTLANLGAASAGYGLGGEAEQKDWSEVDSITANGTYRFNGIHQTINGIYVTSATMLVINFGGSYCTQILRTVENASGHYKSYTLVRSKGAIGWNEWECPDPPLVVGVEYRTTERWKDKAVYTKLVHMGTLPTAGNVTTCKHGAAATNILRCTASTSEGATIPTWYTDEYYGEIGADKNSVFVTAGPSSDYSIVTCDAQIWYTKD